MASGSIAAEITENFVASSAITKSALIILGLVLFLTTLVVNIVARLVVQRSNKALAVTQTLEPPTMAPPADQVVDRPRRRRSVPRSTVIEMAGSAVAAIALVWLCFAVGGIAGPLGFAFCAVSAFLIIYGIVCWLQVRRAGHEGPAGHRGHLDRSFGGASFRSSQSSSMSS